MMFQELVIFAEKNISARKYIFGVFLFFQRGKLHQLKKKKSQQNQPTQICSGLLLLQHQHENIPCVRLYTTRQVLSHTSCDTNAPAFACLHTNTALTC